MSRGAYYNEFDPFAAEWLRKLMLFDLIAPGDIDERSIEDVTPDDLRGYTQCHFFAGIGVWSYSLRRAGWPDSRRIWTASEPCQPFSAAGKGLGVADERYLRPAMQHLIRVCRPGVVVGEQVASKDGLGWLDTLQADLEGEDYAFGALDLCAAGFGAPHIRQRLYWAGVAQGHPCGARLEGQDARPLGQERPAAERAGGGGGLVAVGLGHADGQRQDQVGGVQRGAQPEPEGERSPGGLADARLHERAERRKPATDDDRRGGQGHVEGSEPAPRGALGGLALAHDAERGPDLAGRHDHGGHDAGRAEGAGHLGAGGGSGGLADDASGRRGEERQDGRGVVAGDRAEGLATGSRNGRGHCGPGPVNGAWRDADWLFCRDGKWRPVEPGTSPLVTGAAARVGRLRGYGNAVAAPVAQGFIEAVMDVLDAA